MKTPVLPNDTDQLKQLVASLETRLAEQDSFIEALQEQIRLLKAMQFAKSSEQQTKPAKNEDQYYLFDEAELVVSKDVSVEPEQVEVPSHTRAKCGRKAIPAEIPRVDVVHDISDEEKTCPCGCVLTKIGEEVSEKLDIIPQKVRVMRHIRPKYACKECEGTVTEGVSPTVKVAPMPQQLIKQGIVTPGLLAYILVNKFCDELPFYRQTNMFARLGINIPRQPCRTGQCWQRRRARHCRMLCMSGFIEATSLIWMKPRCRCSMNTGVKTRRSHICGSVVADVLMRQWCCLIIRQVVLVKCNADAG